MIDIDALGAANFIGVNMAFSGAGGDVRVLSIATGWMIEGDIGGDSLADFSIAVNDPGYAIAWAAGDFDLV